MQEYFIKTEVFEGPFELLLTLIEKRKLLINDISLAAVTDDFIAYVNMGEGVPLVQRAHFVLIAATLLLIKSKSLLPTLLLTDEETEGVEDLERRLRLHNIFRRQSRSLQKQFGKRIMYTPNLDASSEPIFSPHKKITIQSIRSAVRNVLNSLPYKEVVPKAIVDKVISLEETMEQLTLRLTKNLNMSFREFTGASKSKKLEVIIGFLAMLELVKQGMLSVTQDKLFADIKMETRNLSTPRYS